jgi:hypothetical protein
VPLAPAGNGSTKPEQFIPFRTDNPADFFPINMGEDLVLQSCLTGERPSQPASSLASELFHRPTPRHHPAGCLMADCADR